MPNKVFSTPTFISILTGWTLNTRLSTRKLNMDKTRFLLIRGSPPHE